MATLRDSRSVKSLNNSEGRKRFVFKSFSEKINDIDLNVFRSLDKVVEVPSKGSTFVKDRLVEWRELNTAADFILLYQELLPFVQTLPLVISQNELIFSKLVSGLQMKARLSLEAFLSLIAALSRDLLEDFVPFLPTLLNSLVTLLKEGGQKQPEIIKQIFSSWNAVVNALQKYLICDIEGTLRDTLELRYYPDELITEFMSPSISFLLRTAPDEQREKGIKRILSEVADPLKQSGGVGLLYFVIKGNSASLHSKAGKVLGFLLKDSTLSLCDSFSQGSGSTVEAVSSTLQRLCEDYKADELSVMWNCLYQETEKSIVNKNSAHLSRLLTVLTSAVRVEKGRKVYDYPSLVGLVSQIVSTFMNSSDTAVEGDAIFSVLDKVMGLMLCTVDRPSVVNEMESIASQWAPIFSLKRASLVTFLRELLKKDKLIVKAFTSNILSSINNMILVSSEEVIPLLLLLCERQQISHDRVTIMEESLEIKYERIHEFLEENIKKIQSRIEIAGLAQSDGDVLATVWEVVNCFPYFEVDSSLLICFKDTLRQHLAASVETCSAQELMWQSLLGAVLRSCHKLRSTGRLIHSDLEEALSLAKCYKSCVQVLSPVADYLDFVYRPLFENDKACPEFQADNTEDAFAIFSENLRHSNKDVRLMTLRILSHFETLLHNLSSEEHHPQKKQKTQKSLPQRNVLQLLHAVERSPLTVLNERELVSLITRIQMDLSACRIHEAYVPLVFNGMIGLFHNRFSKIWEPASECLAVLLKKHTGAVWNEFVRYLVQCQLKLEEDYNHSESDIKENDSDLIGRWNLFLVQPSDSTPNTTVVSLLLQTLKKVPAVAQARASEVLPLLLEFLGYKSENLVKVGSFSCKACKGKEWKGLLIQWLTLLKLMKNPGSSSLSLFVNDVLQNRFLDDNDAEIQTNVLDCLVMWNDYLIPHRQHLESLIKRKEFREELTTWTVLKDIEEAHRSHLVSLVVRILVPKVRNLKISASRKHTSISHRKAILCFISQLDVNELALFFALLMKPLNIISVEAMDLFWSSGVSSLDCFQKSNFLKYFTVDTFSTLTSKKKSGFLHVIQHIFEVFNEFQLRPFLDFLMGCVVRLMVNYAPVIGEEMIDIDKENVLTNHDQAGTSIKQFKELRSLGLKIISHVLEKYEDCDLGSEFWDLFFSAVNPLIKNFKQEGSSSETASSLFSCFLSMSKNRNLVTFLCREEFLVPDIFSILTVPSANEAIKSTALKFIENLLNIENELEEDDHMFKGLLDPYIEALINSLHSLFLVDKRKSAKYHGAREIKILKLLSKHMRDASHVIKYLDILLTFLDQTVKDSEIHREALLAIQDITLFLGTENTSKIIKIVSPLLVDADINVRLCICYLLESLAKVDFALDHVAKCVRDMNAISPMEVDELDYETIVNAYGEIDVDFFNKTSPQHMMIILSQSIYNISSEELSLKDCACNLLGSFIEFLASILWQGASSQSDTGKEVAKADASWTMDRILSVVNKFLLQHIGDAINRGNSSGKEEVLLIRKMVVTFPDAGNLAAFRPLCSEDDEVDFFKNIFSIQAHRRARAIKRFAKVTKDGSLPEGVVRNFFVSVFFNMFLDGEVGKNKNIQDACKEALESISSHMSWNSYYAILNRCFREMTKHTKKRNLLLQLIRSILDKFHFSKDGYTQEAVEIRACIEKTFLKVQKLMDPDSVSIHVDSINVESYVTAVKVLKLLPAEMMDAQLDSLVSKVSSYLKSPLTSTRDKARMALASCLKEIGLEYLQFVLKNLRARLTRGSEVNVLGYTVHFILSECLPNPIVGKLDHCLGDLLAVVEDDIKDVDEQKEGRVFKMKKEKKTCKSFKTLQLIAKNVTFRNHALELLSPVTRLLQGHLTPKLKSKLEKMLKSIATGIEDNPSVDQGDLFCFVYHGIDNRSDSGDQVAFPPSKKQMKSRGLEKTAGAKSCPHLVLVFYLDLLHNRLKKMNLNNNKKVLLSMLDPFVKLLVGCLSSKYEDVVSSSVRCFTALIRLELPSFISEEDKVKTAVLTLAQSAVSSSSPLLQSCLKLLTALLNKRNLSLSSEQLNMLIEFDLESDSPEDSYITYLSFIMAIMGRKLAVPQLYDIANQVSAVMIKTQKEPIRKKCKDLLLKFLVHYTRSEKCVEGHVMFLQQNLSYEHPTGRLAALDMLQALIEKVKSSEPNLGKQSVLDKQSQNLFIELAQRLATDGSNEVLSKIGGVMKVLIGCISKNQVDSSLETCLVWYKQEDSRAKAAQVLGLFIEARKEAFPKHIRDMLLQEVRTILEAAVQLQDTVYPAYYSLVMIEKMLQQFPDLCFGKALEVVWKMVFKLLVHPHEWLRAITCRLLNYYFKELGARKKGKPQNLVADSLLEKPSSLFMVAAALCFQLKVHRSTGNINADIIGEDMVIKNIVFAVSSLHSMIGQSDDEYWSCLDKDTQVEFLEAFVVFDAGNVRSTFLALTSGNPNENGKDDVRNVLIGTLLKRMGKLALDMEPLQMRIVFNVFKGFCSQLDLEECRLYAFRILLPLYKVCQGFTGKVISVELKELAEGVRDSIRDKSIGSNMFVQVYRDIINSLETKRKKRKRDEKLMAVINPERNAKRKLKLAAKNKANKKRKIMSHKMSRWARS